MSVPAEAIEMARQALAEVIPDQAAVASIRQSTIPGAFFVCSLTVPVDLRRRASRLVRWRLDGPEVPVVCDAHYSVGRPHLWEQCGRVRVVDALRGRHCQPSELNT